MQQPEISIHPLIGRLLTNQYINQLAVQFKTSTNPDMRRYERPHVNESGAEIPVWDLI